MALKGFFALLVVSIIQTIILAGMSEKDGKAFEHIQLAVFEAVDTVIVLLVWAWCGSARLLSATADRRVFAWVLALPLLAALVGVNVLYHAAIREYVKIEWFRLPEPAGVTLVGVLLECVQPGIVEEFFFRYLLLGVLRRYGGVHGAVLVSAAMFGVCHIHVFLSMPYLFALGVFLGYVRVWSRSLALPVLLHVTHNLAVTWLEEFL
ncbi:CPBP family intramembrane glutamic endopeptidase [Limnoglobus roseus]|uniref:CPBP family intramembrane metalloprotease n=1 Tax=Limnoglobus roseus TaxID=2598579 RepID=A0A5C1AAV0_9BACT|nr:CPBP family intramembrane glutamic endopeptidase [Limnoglobus roseus]QEL15146.1 CPBP family intramembrane metalloprotease [Limnoglobus roseus]